MLDGFLRKCATSLMSINQLEATQPDLQDARSQTGELSTSTNQVAQGAIPLPSLAYVFALGYEA